MAGKKAKAIGFNHIALEVGDVDDALAFYSRLFDFKLRSRTESAAFIDLGDQFLALQKGRRQTPDDDRHVGLVVDDKQSVRDALAEVGIEPLPGPFLDFRDPWGNRVTKASHILRGMGLAHLAKSESAIEELRAKGMAPE
jgi:catechol 2,3-dioxygenase-like lactoylglutathione lyase family enzyme